MASSNFAFLHGLENLSEVRELFSFDEGFNEAAGEEANCFISVTVIANSGSLDGNHLDGGPEYFG